jgi:hypothetical protein
VRVRKKREIVLPLKYARTAEKLMIRRIGLKKYCENCGKRLVALPQKYVPRGYNPYTGKKKKGFEYIDWVCPEIIEKGAEEAHEHTVSTEYLD